MKTLIAVAGVSLVLVSHSEAFCQSGKIRIAAASDVKFALDSAIALFKEGTSQNVVVTYGSSGKLFEQILSGAPFDIFFSADLIYPEKLSERGAASGKPEVYGTGRLVIWSNVIKTDKVKMQSLSAKPVRRIALANPQHAPYGKRAEEALRYYGLYDQLQPKFVFGENISQTAQYVYSGAAEVGLIALSLAVAPPMQKAKGVYYIIPEESHAPLHQAFIVISDPNSNRDLARFYEFIKSEKVKDVFRYFGFAVSATK